MTPDERDDTELADDQRRRDEPGEDRAPPSSERDGPVPFLEELFDGESERETGVGRSG